MTESIPTKVIPRSMLFGDRPDPWQAHHQIQPMVMAAWKSVSLLIACAFAPCRHFKNSFVS